MDEAILYHLSMAMYGCVIGWFGLSRLAPGEVAIAPLLFVVGGAGIVVGTVYELILSTDPPTTPTDGRIVWLTAVGALVAVIGAIVSTLS